RRTCFSLFFTTPPTTAIYTLSLHDALPILFQGPYDNPGLDILAVRETPEYEVGLEVSGTIQQPKSTIRPPEGMSESESMAILLTDRKSTRLNSSHVKISYAVFCLKKKKIQK